MALARERHQGRAHAGEDQAAMRATLLQRSADCIAAPSSTGAYAVRKEATKLTALPVQPLDSTYARGGLGTCYTVCTMVRRVFAVVSLVVGGAAACASPTLPLPPPAVPTIGPGPMAGQVHLASPCGGAEAGATVLVINNNEPSAQRDAVTVSDNCGSWSLDAYANKGDYLPVQQIVGSEISSSVSVQVQ